VDKLETLLKESVQRRLVSEVPLGAFLSGGLDSSVVVGTMAGIMDRPVQTFTIDFAEQGFSESADARLVSEAFKTDHKEFTVQSDAIALLPDLVWHFDEPFADSSAVPTYYVSKMARQDVTVVLSGDGGDELFAGYNDYAKCDMLNPFWRIPAPIRRGIIGPLGKLAPIHFPGKNWLVAIGKLEQYKAGRIFDIFPLIKDNLFSPEFRRSLQGRPAAGDIVDYWKNLPDGPTLSRAQYADTKIYLPEDILMKVDRMSMACSLETRAPLLDYEIAEFAASIPPELQRKDGKGKYVLRQVAARFLPQSVLTKKKQGFAIPRDEWFRGALQTYAEGLLKSEKFRRRGYFSSQVVDRILAGQRTGRHDYGFWIWALINFELWHREFIDAETRRI
jgi:asparagine synthase (glutamine-hydrolysing)